jgi:hypothetical protein
MQERDTAVGILLLANVLGPEWQDKTEAQRDVGR